MVVILNRLFTLYIFASSNHRLESGGLNALEELLLMMLGMDREDSNTCLVCKGNWIDYFRKRDRKLALPKLAN